MAHANARLTEFGRLLLVQRITELGWPAAQAAEALGVSRATAYKWLARYRLSTARPGWPTAAPDPTAAPTRCRPPRCVGCWPLAAGTARDRIALPGGCTWLAPPSMGCFAAIT